jgi:fused signal recognition particle receptor
MSVIVWVVVGLVVAAAVYFLFLRKKGAEELPGEPTKPALPEKKEKKEEPAQAPPPEARKPVPPAPSPKAPPADLKTADLKATVRETPQAKVEAPAAKPEPAPPPKVKKKGDVAGLRKGLVQARTGFVARLFGLFAGKKEIDPALLGELEEVMLTSDVGVKTTQTILERLKERLERSELADGDAVRAALRAEASRILSIGGGPIRDAGKPTVVLMVGVNGVGKTTTIGKLATRFGADGKKVVLAAGDTFRAAAVQQLEVWGKRTGAEVVRGKDGSDPGAVAYEATTKAKESGADVLLVDTAGRLHTKAPLMDEIKKVRKTIAKALDGAPHETLLVLDATTGQNALTQAQMFKEAVDLTGIVLTKLDGTAKGGIVLAICDELKVPVRYVGLGERAEDLRDFDPDDFVEALFGDGEGEAQAA